VNPLDLLGAVSYILRKEVPLHSTVSGTAFTVLLRLTHLLENVFTKAYPVAAVSLSQVRERLETRLSAGFITNRDWSRLLNTKLNESLFPLNPDWHHCRGSQSHFRGYPCSLWSLAHTLTVLTLPVQPGTDSSASLSLSPGMTFRSKDALNIFSRFVQNFFSCDYCREHFTEMARTLEEGKVLHDGDAVLWLWEAHNTVSRRLVKDISSDPLYPKLPFPSVRHCPYCYKQIYSSDVQGRVAVARPNWINTGFRSRAESFLEHNVAAGNLRYVWNRTAVLLYLWNFYHWNDTHTISQKEILQAAWPRLFVPQQQAYRPTQQGIGFSTYDLGLCVSYYIVCGTLLLVVGYWLIRRRLRHRRHFLHP
jgi:thiol oxidase